MMEKLMYWNDVPGIIFIAIIILATGLGIYGFFMITGLRNRNYSSRDEQVDRVIMGLFNMAISLFAMGAVILILRINTHEFLAQSNRLIEHIKTTNYEK